MKELEVLKPLLKEYDFFNGMPEDDKIALNKIKECK